MKETAKRTVQREKPPSYELTSEANLKFVEKKDAVVAKTKPKPPSTVPSTSKGGAKTPPGSQDGTSGAYLGVGPSKLMVTRGEQGYLCLYCKKGYQEGLAFTPLDRWVRCSSCKHVQHSYCMAKCRKCVCGAAAPRKK